MDVEVDVDGDVYVDLDVHLVDAAVRLRRCDGMPTYRHQARCGCVRRHVNGGHVQVHVDVDVDVAVNDNDNDNVYVYVYESANIRIADARLVILCSAFAGRSAASTLSRCSAESASGTVGRPRCGRATIGRIIVAVCLAVACLA